jgi:hypothetical protein
MTDLHRQHKTELAELVSQFVRSDNPGEAWNRIEQWVDVEFALREQHGRSAALADWIHDRGSWWERNWFPVVMIAMFTGGSLLIGFVNGWS